MDSDKTHEGKCLFYFPSGPSCAHAISVEQPWPAPPMTDCTTYEYGNRLDELIWKYCPADKVCAYNSSDDFMRYSKKRRFYDNEDYIKWFGFGVESEAQGEYTWVGRLFSLFPDVDPESPFGDFIRSME